MYGDFHSQWLDRGVGIISRQVLAPRRALDLLHKSVKNQGVNLVLSVSICVHLWFPYLKL